MNSQNTRNQRTWLILALFIARFSLFMPCVRAEDAKVVR